MNQFADNVLEYWEIPGLIEHYNPSYLNSLEQYYYNPDGSTGLSKDQLTSIASELRDEARELEEELEEKLDSKLLVKDDAGYLDYKDNIKTLKRFAREMEDAAKGSASTKRVLRIARNQLIVEISGKMREYQMAVSQNEIQKKQLEIRELSGNAARRKAELGMCSVPELRAEEQALAAQQVLKAASDAELAQKKAELIVSMGWSREGNPEIIPIPEPDLTKIAAYNLESDMKAAVDSNYDVNDIRRTDSSEYGGASKKRDELSTAEKNVKMQFELLYKNVLSQEEAYRGAQIGWGSAEKKMAQAERKFALDMISRLEYLQAEAEWLSAKASREQAALNLTAAMETYEWAVKGLIVQTAGR